LRLYQPLPETPALTAAEMACWSIVLPGLRRLFPVQLLARMMWTGPGAERSSARERGIVGLSERLSRLRRARKANCLERSLLAYRFLSRAGADPRLVLGVGRTNGRVIGHAWIVVDEVPLFDTAEALQEFAPIAAFGSHGAPIDGAGAERLLLPREWR
jgi:Transglutaminase-like superfamily